MFYAQSQIGEGAATAGSVPATEVPAGEHRRNGRGIPMMRILLVSYWFPPTNEIGAVRAGKLAAFLQGQGHDVRVLSGPATGDLSLPLEIAADRVTRAMPEGSSTGGIVIDRGANWFRNLLHPPGSETDKLWSRLRSHYESLRNVPDKRSSWKRPAVAAGLDLLQSWQPDLILASAPPFTGLFVAAALSQSSGIPWVAEMRDPWVGNPYLEEPSWRRWLDRFLERRALNSAVSLVTVSPTVGSDLEQRYGKPVTTVLNGFSEEDFPATVHQTPGGRLSIVYTGVIYAGLRDPSALFAAMAMLGPQADEIEVTFYGPPAAELIPMAERYGVADKVSVRPSVPYKESLARQAAADVLLLLQRSHPTDAGNIPAKFFEYIGARRPILLIGCETGVIANMIRSRRAGCVANDPRAIAGQLLDWLEQKRRGIPPLPLTVRAGLSRREQFADYELFLSKHIRSGAQPDLLRLA